MTTIEQEGRIAYNTPAQWTNRFNIDVRDDRVRIAFAEAAPGEDRAYTFHSAIITSTANAKALMVLLQKLLS